MFRSSLTLVCLLLFSIISLAEDAPAPAAAETPPQAVPRVVAARVGNAEITAQDLVQFAALNPQRVRTLAAGAEGKATILRMVIANTLLQQAMAEADLLPAESDPRAYQQAYAKLAEIEFPLPDKIDDAELLSYYSSNKEAFGIPASARLMQIQTRFPDGAGEADKAAARARAEQALARVRSGEDFGAVAAELTENEPARSASGDLGFIERNTWSPWLQEALAGVEVGQYTDVLPSPTGFEILKITDVREAVIPDFEEVREDVFRVVQTRRQNALRDKFIRELARDTDIVVVMDDVKEYFATGVFPE